MNRKERRQHPRIARPLIIKYRCPAAWQIVWQVSSTKDLSVGGVRLIAEREYAVGTVIELQLQLPVPRPVLTLKGKVVWTRVLGRGPMAEHGIQFQAMDDMTAGELRRIVEWFVSREAPRKP